MANTIANFLVGIGYDYDKKGEKQIGSGIDSIKSKALQLGTVVAGAFGIKALTSDFANAKDKLGQFSKVFGSTADEVNSLGNAFVKEGGTLDGFLGQLSGIEKLRSGLLVGNAGFIAQMGKAGIDEDVIIGAENATDAYIALAASFESMSQQERLNAAASLGLDEASITLLSKGEKEVRRIVEAQKRIRPISKEMIASAREYKEETADLGNNIGGFADKVSVRLLPEINNIMSGMNSWLDVNREVINSGVDGTLDVVADNFGLIAGTLGIIAASSAFGMFAKMGRFIPVVGKLVTAFGLLGSSLMVWAAAAFAAWQIGTKIGEAINENIVDDPDMHIGRGVAKAMAFFGSDTAQAALDSEEQNKIQKNKEEERNKKEALNVLSLVPIEKRDSETRTRRGKREAEKPPKENVLSLVPVDKRDSETKTRLGKRKAKQDRKRELNSLKLVTPDVPEINTPDIAKPENPELNPLKLVKPENPELNPLEIAEPQVRESNSQTLMEVMQPSTPENQEFMQPSAPIVKTQASRETKRNASNSTTKIEVRNVIEMDGTVISEKVNTEMGKEVERALADTKSTNEG